MREKTPKVTREKKLLNTVKVTPAPKSNKACGKRERRRGWSRKGGGGGRLVRGKGTENRWVRLAWVSKRERA